MAEENITTATNETTTTAATTETTATTATETETKSTDNAPMTAEAIDKLVQSRTDKALAEYGKKIAELQKENSKLKKDSLSAEELKKFEISEKEKSLAEKEKDLLDRENRLYAIKAIKEIGLDDGSEKALSLVDFVMADSEEKITDRVKAFNDLVQSFVSARVDEKFKAIGRTPNGATQATETSKEINIAESLGKKKAEQSKKSNDVLNMYLGRR